MTPTTLRIETFLQEVQQNGGRVDLNNAAVRKALGPAKLYRILRSHAQTSGDSRPYTRQRFIAELGGFYGSIDVRTYDRHPSRSAP